MVQILTKAQADAGYVAGQGTLDTTGVSFTPSGFAGHLKADTVVPTSTFTFLPWAHSYDTDGYIDTASPFQVATVPEAGRYLIKARVGLPINATGERILSIQYRPDALSAWVEYGRDAFAVCSAINKQVLRADVQPGTWAAGSQFIVRLWQSSGANMTVLAAELTSYFAIERLA